MDFQSIVFRDGEIVLNLNQLTLNRRVTRHSFEFLVWRTGQSR